MFKYGSAFIMTYSDTACAARAAVGSGPSGNFVAVALANIDADPTIDQWSVASASRVLGGANCTADPNAPAGEPVNDQNDTIL